MARGETAGLGETMIRGALTVIALAVAAAAGLGAGYVLWNKKEVNWYAVDINKLGPGPENDLIRYGRDLIVNTARHIGKNATDPALRYAGNDLSCQNCHLNAGLQPFAAPFISTFATFPMMVDDQVLTLTGRLNGCMRRSLNGKDLPPDSREMQAIIAYIKFVGTGTPDGVRLPGMGLKPLANPQAPPELAAGAGGLRTAVRQVSQGRWPRRVEGKSRRRLFHPPALGRGEFQCGCRHGQDRLRRRLYSRQHALRHQLCGSGADRSAGLGRGGLHGFQASPSGDARDGFRSAIAPRLPRPLRTREP